MASPASKKRNTVPMDGNAAYDLHSTAAEEYRYSCLLYTSDAADDQ